MIRPKVEHKVGHYFMKTQSHDLSLKETVLAEIQKGGELDFKIFFKKTS